MGKVVTQVVLPPLPRHYGVLRLLAARPAALRFLRLTVPCARSSFAPGDGERSAPGPGLLNRVPVPGLDVVLMPGRRIA